MFKTAQVCAVIAFTLFFSAQTFAQSDVPDVSNLQITDPSAAIEPRIIKMTGEIEIFVTLTDPPLAAVVGNNARRAGFRLSSEQQRAYIASLTEKQNNLMRSIAANGGRDLGRVTRAHNAIAVTIDASRVRTIATFPNVAAIRLVNNYELALSTTVPYVGAAALHSTGVDGTGVRVAVLDSGIDYTHRNFGGPGTAAAYTAAYGASTADSRNKTLDGLFPTAKVTGGFDFVGEVWPNGPLAPDPDPIDCGPGAIMCAGGHGTHVADILGGNDGSAHKGVAPGAKLLAVKVCSAVSTSCSGVALLQGMDFALDPNGDGDISDSVDVINMSLGTNYGMVEDDLSFASSIASQLGVVVVSAAGNAADRPYIVSSPSTAPEVISVAQTQVPTAAQDFLAIVSPPSIAGNYIAVFQPWSAPLTAVIQNPIQYGDGAGGNLDGCAAFAAGSLTGKIGLVNRGTCAFSDKIRNIANGGGAAGIIALVDVGDPFEGAFGGGPAITIPGYMISLATGNTIKGQLAAGVVARLDPNNRISLVMTMVSSSARGPSYSSNAIKPDIGAPGASVSAVAGSGTGEVAFGGTSGATPMVSGAAALLIQQFPTILPADLKARLMNSANSNILTNPVSLPGVLAPISRIGAGELRVNLASQTTTTAWDKDNPAAVSLSFGHFRTFGASTYQKTVEVRNHSGSARTYSITPMFRYASDAGGAVTLTAPPSVTVPANGTNSFALTLNLNAALLPAWTLNGGSQGGNGPLLQSVEYDGYVRISGGGDNISLPWHILPHKAANVRPSTQVVPINSGTGSFTLTNAGGALTGRIDTFPLTGTSPQIPANALPHPGDNFAVVDLKSVGVRLANSGLGPAVQFAMNTWGDRAHPNYPAEFDIYIDTNRDGTEDYVLFNAENGGFGATGQNITVLLNLQTNAQTIRFFTDADLDSSNVIYTAVLADMGMTPSSKFDFFVLAFDNFFTGSLTDAIGFSPAAPMTFQLNLPRFVAGAPTSIAPGASATVPVVSPPGGDAASPSQRGFLLMYRDAKAGVEADAILTPVVTPPVVTSLTATPASINEGGVTTLSGSFTDPDITETHTVTINWGDGSSSTLSLAPGVLNFSATHQYLDDNPTGTSSDLYVISANVVDSLGGSASRTATVQVSNLAPAVTGLPALVSLGTAATVNATFTANFTDAGTTDTHTCTLSWDSGPAVPGVVTETNGSGTCSGTKTYSGAGIHSITATLTDDDGGSTSDTDFVVIYDPTVGYVSGAGFINSPAGAYPADPSLSGKANFAFNLRYKLGSNVPIGPSTFNFNLANLQFAGSIYDWLVVSPPAAQFTGTGTINGAGSYGFTTIILDGQLPGGAGVDRFRIRIWNLNPDGSAGSIVYDNVPGAPVDFESAHLQSIGGGSILLFLDTPPSTPVNLIVDSPVVPENTLVVHLEGEFTDPDLGDTHTVTINWGDGTSSTVPRAPGYFVFAANHYYLDDNPTGTPSDVYTISVVVEDGFGKVSGAGTKIVTVNNVAPVVTGDTWPTGLLGIGAPATVKVNFRDAGIRDTHTCQVAWGDSTTSSGTVTEASANPPASFMSGSCSATHNYTAGGSYEVAVTVVDDDGGSVTDTGITINVNSAPVISTINLSANSINENGQTTLTGTFTDADISTHSVTINWGDGATNTISLNNVALEFSATHRYLDDNPTGTSSDVYNIGVSVKDPANGTATGAAVVTVTNANPAISSVLVNNVANSNTVAPGSPATVKANFTDAGMKDTHTCQIAWGDTSSDAGAITETNGSGSCTAMHTYAAPGTYMGTVNVTDDDGGVTPRTFQVVVR